jgi:protein-S-isoprenylcysteine O-methyltransferase Ste14
MTVPHTNTPGSILSDPRVDKTIAVIACLPIAYVIYLRLHQGTLDIVRINLILQSLLLVVTMIARRSPVRVTMNPWYWLLAFVATYWVTFTALMAAPGTPVVPRWFTIALSWLGLALMVYARVSLGRNIGFVPAQRQLVMTGAYRVMRHPIYTAAFINYLALVLLHYTSGNLVIVTLGVLWFVVKSFVEERFLAQDPEYASYMQRVRRRWIPGVV